MLEARNISKSYKSKKVLDNFSIIAKDGEITSILGKSGIGKTTLAMVLCLHESADGGSILLNGEDLLALGKKEKLKRRRKIQLIFQNPLSSFDPLWSIKRSLLEGAEDKLKAEAKIYELTESLGIGYINIEARPDKLSGGEIQRLAIIRALLAEPDVIVADEITSSMDSINRKAVLDMLKTIKKNAAIIFITHDRDAAEYISDAIVEIKEN